MYQLRVRIWIFVLHSLHEHLDRAAQHIGHQLPAKQHARVTVQHHDQKVEHPLDLDVSNVGVPVVVRVFGLVPVLLLGGIRIAA